MGRGILEDNFHIFTCKNEIVGQAEIKISLITQTAEENKMKELIYIDSIKNEVLMVISRALADFGLDDLDIVLYMLFIKAEKYQPNQVTIDQFKDFILNDLKAPISLQDLNLFVQTNICFRNFNGLVDKVSLIKLFEKSFTEAMVRFREL